MVGVEELLNDQRIESSRIEFKAGWNPDSIYRSICAFANDVDNSWIHGIQAVLPSD